MAPKGWTRPVTMLPVPSPAGRWASCLLDNYPDLFGEPPVGVFGPEVDQDLGFTAGSSIHEILYFRSLPAPGVHGDVVRTGTDRLDFIQFRFATYLLYLDGFYVSVAGGVAGEIGLQEVPAAIVAGYAGQLDRKSTRLNSSHVRI